MKHFRVFAGVLAIALVTAATASASPITETFTISGLTGPLAGNTYTGSFTWDSSNVNLTAFSTDFPSWVDATTNDGATLADIGFAYYDDPGLELFYLPSPDGNPDAFAFFGGNPLFTYGTTADGVTDFDDAGQGTVTYGPITGATPEPGSFLLLATGLAGMAGAVRRKLRA